MDPPAFPGRDRGDVKRWPALALIVAVVAGALTYDQRPDTGRASRSVGVTSSLADLPTADDVDDMMPQGLPTSAAASTWYCAGGTATGADPAEPAPEPPEIAPGVPGVPEVVADHVVVIANPTAGRLSGVVTVYPSEGDRTTGPIDVGPGDRVSFHLADVVRAPYAAAMVELEGGGAVVEHELHGPYGTTSAPCASAGSSQWFFAAGSTERGASEVLVFFNPYPSAAIVDVSFATDQGRREPGAFQDLPIPAHSVRAIPVTDKVTIRKVVAASVIVRIGRLVVDRIQTWDGTPPPKDEEEGGEEGGEEGEGDADDEASEPTTTTTAAPPPPEQDPAAERSQGERRPAEDPPGERSPDEQRPAEEPPGEERPGEEPPEARSEEDTSTPPEAEPLPPVTRKGLTVSLGMPRPAASWFFPDGHRSEGASLQYVVYNPTDLPAKVETRITLAEPDKNGTLDPVGLTIAPGVVEVFDIDDDVRVPLDTPFHVSVHSVNEVPVVAEQVNTGRMFGADGGVIVPGSPLVARRWQFASGTANDDTVVILALSNPGDRTATVDVELLAGREATVLTGSVAIELPPGGHATRTVNDAVQGDELLLRVTSDRPIVAERIQYRTGSGTGFTASIGIPMPDGIRLP
jgi:hypothetical protein